MEGVSQDRKSTCEQDIKAYSSRPSYSRPSHSWLIPQHTFPSSSLPFPFTASNHGSTPAWEESRLAAERTRLGWDSSHTRPSSPWPHGTGSPPPWCRDQRSSATPRRQHTYSATDASSCVPAPHAASAATASTPGGWSSAASTCCDPCAMGEECGAGTAPRNASAC